MTKKDLQIRLDKIDQEYSKIKVKDFNRRWVMLNRMERIELAMELIDSGAATCGIQALLMVE